MFLYLLTPFPHTHTLSLNLALTFLLARTDASSFIQEIVLHLDVLMDLTCTSLFIHNKQE
jgi:hypothetical protein